MKILEVNSVNYGSTGSIMFAIADTAEQQGHIVYTTSGFTKRKKKRARWFMTSHAPAKLFHTYMARLTGLNGCFSFLPTLGLLWRIGRIRPDIIHCHNLHGWYLNLPLFFQYVKKHEIPVVWTLHDCWAMTAQCPHFTILKCDKWKTGCFDCPYPHNEYPQAWVDKSCSMWKWKRKWFTGVQSLVLVTPSQWLADLVKKSYLQNYPVNVIHNGIDLEVFRPTESDFIQRYKLEMKYIVLGVSLGWDYKKGLDVFIRLAKTLGSAYQVVLVGTDAQTDMRLPDNVISIHSTQDQTELAQMYTAADVFVNPTREENFPTVNMEAIACGTPVVTFRTGGSAEMLDDGCGCVVDCDDEAALAAQIRRVCEEKPFRKEDCIRHAAQFSASDTFMSYVQLYEDMIKTRS